MNSSVPESEGRLQPPQIVAFLQELPRRLLERLDELDESNGDRPDGADGQVRAITDRLGLAIDKVLEMGYPADIDLTIELPERWLDDPSSTGGLLAAAATELAQRTAGVPTESWVEHPEELAFVREACADASEALQSR